MLGFVALWSGVWAPNASAQLSPPGERQEEIPAPTDTADRQSLISPWPSVLALPHHDYDGDGAIDLLAASDASSAGARFGGSVVILSARTLQTLAVVASGEPFERVGHAIASVGDVDGDGRPEVVFTSLGIESREVQKKASGSFAVVEQRSHRGSVRCIGSKSGELLWVHRAEVPEDGFGHSLCPVGDVDGDGVADLAVSGLSSGGRWSVSIVSTSSGRFLRKYDAASSASTVDDAPASHVSLLSADPRGAVLCGLTLEGPTLGSKRGVVLGIPFEPIRDAPWRMLELPMTKDELVLHDLGHATEDAYGTMVVSLVDDELMLVEEWGAPQTFLDAPSRATTWTGFGSTAISGLDVNRNGSAEWWLGNSDEWNSSPRYALHAFDPTSREWLHFLQMEAGFQVRVLCWTDSNGDPTPDLVIGDPQSMTLRVLSGAMLSEPELGLRAEAPGLVLLQARIP